MSVEYSFTIESKSHDLSMTIETHEEHHMGASSVFIVLSRPIGSVSRFQTTNGDAFFTPDGNNLVIHDACVILVADLVAGEVFHYEPPKKWYVSEVRIGHESLLIDLYDGYGKRKANTPVPLVDIASEFASGFGRVDAGRFPSAYP